MAIVYAYPRATLTPKKMNNWLGSYELGGLIRGGSEGAIHRACDRRTGKVVAVKVVKMVTPAIRKRCFEEVSIMRECTGEHVIGFHAHSIDVARSLSGLIMDCGNEDYLDVINERLYVAEEVLLGEFRQIARAVKFLHDRNIAHMDIKPENILVTHELCSSGELRYVLKLIDFAFATRSAQHCMCVASCGTRGYVAPEMYAAFPNVYTKPVDIYAVGVTLYVATQRKLPFEVTGSSEMCKRALSMPVCFSEPTSLLVETLILEAMSIDPERRPTIEEICIRVGC